MLNLRVATTAAWLEAVIADFDAFIVDHAACERKAAATGMAFVVRYPDRIELLDPMIAFAREELEHFHQVYRLIERRGLRLSADEPDPYVGQLRALVRGGRDQRLLDRLLVAAVVEARGCERFGMLARGLPDPELRAFYEELAKAEARHHALFPRLARHYFDERVVTDRVEQLLDAEAKIVEKLPVRPALH